MANLKNPPPSSQILLLVLYKFPRFMYSINDDGESRQTGRGIVVNA